MTTLTIEAVRELDPGAMASAGRDLGDAADLLRREAAHLTAYDDVHAIGAELADALAEAREALAGCAADLAQARTRVVNLVDTALARGYEVSDDGAVSAPHRPLAVDGLRERRADRLGRELRGALDALSEADTRTAQALTAIEFPATLRSEIEAYVSRLITSKDVVGSLGTTVEGSVTGAMIAKKGLSLTVKGTALARFLKTVLGPLAGYGNLARNLGTANQALRQFMVGRSAGILRAVLGARVSSLIGRIFLPLTVITGLIEVCTGGGYRGLRGLATRAWGFAGAAGAGLLLVSYTHWLALGALESAVCGTAVLLYGLWSLGNAVWDHRSQLWRLLLWLGRLPVRLFRRTPDPAEPARPDAVADRVGAS